MHVSDSRLPKAGKSVLNATNVSRLVGKAVHNDDGLMHSCLSEAALDYAEEAAQRFAETVSHFACRLAKHRRSSVLQQQDIALAASCLHGITDALREPVSGEAALRAAAALESVGCKRGDTGAPSGPAKDQANPAPVHPEPERVPPCPRELPVDDAMFPECLPVVAPEQPARGAGSAPALPTATPSNPSPAPDAAPSSRSSVPESVGTSGAPAAGGSPPRSVSPPPKKLKLKLVRK
ncbi:hypothetical protein DIPPA_04485 [Diplonema papillatum]|nr:hypothetical protein DIPPA_04485 [Diplonema papillatum]